MNPTVMRWFNSQVRVGMMVCSPEQAKFRAQFRCFQVTEPAVKGLYP